MAANPASELALSADYSNCDSCAHSHRLNCVLKARAFWWMMARLAGWDGVTTGSITVTSPNGGEPFQVGSIHNITWSAQNVVGTLKITLWKDGAVVGVIVSGIAPSSSSYSWTVGSSSAGTSAAGNGYTIKIKEKGMDVADISDASFTLTD